MKEKIHAVSNNDLEGLLEKIGLIESIEKKELHCCCCEKELSQENIGCIFPLKDEVKLCCDSLECLEKTIEQSSPLRRIAQKEGA